MEFPGRHASEAGTSTRRTGENRPAELQLHGSDVVDTATEKPEMEAYLGGSWWDVEILEKSGSKENQYFWVHFVNFPVEQDQWVRSNHLRMRSRTLNESECCLIKPGMDVCVMTLHPHSVEELPAWFDAKIIGIVRKPHTPEYCKCSFRIALYTKPKDLPRRDCKHRELLPFSPDTVVLANMCIMRAARGMHFEDALAASVTPRFVGNPRIWAKDAKRWCSSFCGCGNAGNAHPCPSGHSVS